MHNSRNMTLIFCLTQATILLLFDSNIPSLAKILLPLQTQKYPNMTVLYNSNICGTANKNWASHSIQWLFSRSLNKGPENKLLAWALHQWFNIALFFISLNLNSFTEEWHFYEEMIELKVYLKIASNIGAMHRFGPSCLLASLRLSVSFVPVLFVLSFIIY